jgi:high affinity Mn2+ porin
LRKLLVIFASLLPAVAAGQNLTGLPDGPAQKFLLAPRTSLTNVPVASYLSSRLFSVLAQANTTALSDVSSPQPLAPDIGVTVFRHSETAPWWISGQANIIFQAHPGFHSPYQGPNSFRNAGEYKTSMLGTVFTGYQPHRNLRYNTDFLVDFESAGGRGLSEALGLAGFTNLDVVRNPNLSSVPYLARGEIHQTIGLTNEMAESGRSYLSLATQVPVRRFEFRIGKMSLTDIFDVNGVLTDSHLQFLNWTVDNNGAWDYAADTRGYTVGGALEYDDRNWSARYGIFAMPIVANGIDLDWAFSRAHGQNWEFEVRRSFLHGRKGVTRVLAFANSAHMGNYREAVQAYLAGIDPSPEITRHEHFGTVKYGLEWNNEQEFTENLRIGTRFGWNDDQEESYAYTEVGQTALLGFDYAGARWQRPSDKIGISFVSNAIKKDHQNYLKDGGRGFLLGDGRLNYGRENIEEGYYDWHSWKGVFFALDVQHIDDPGYNRDRGPVWVGGVRTHVDF